MLEVRKTDKWKIEIEIENKDYTITDNSIEIFKRTMGRSYGNGFGTIYELRGKKTIHVYEYNVTWACRGMGMNDRRFTKIVNEELYEKIKGIIQEIKSISSQQIDEDTKYEKYAEILENIDVDTFYDYL